MDCLFCNIVKGRIAANIVFEDDDVIAFHDIESCDDLHDSDSQIAGRLLISATHIARQLGMSDDGYRIVINTKSHGGQEVYHIHLHLLGGRPLQWPPG